MNKKQIADASIETLNARKEALANRSGIDAVRKHKEWHEIAAEIEARKGYASYSMLVDSYTRYVAAYTPNAAARDGQ